MPGVLGGLAGASPNSWTACSGGPGQSRFQAKDFPIGKEKLQVWNDGWIYVVVVVVEWCYILSYSMLQYLFEWNWLKLMSAFLEMNLDVQDMSHVGYVCWYVGWIIRKNDVDVKHSHQKRRSLVSSEEERFWKHHWKTYTWTMECQLKGFSTHVVLQYWKNKTLFKSPWLSALNEGGGSQYIMASCLSPCLYIYIYIYIFFLYPLAGIASTSHFGIFHLMLKFRAGR